MRVFESKEGFTDLSFFLFPNCHRYEFQIATLVIRHRDSSNSKEIKQFDKKMINQTSSRPFKFVFCIMLTQRGGKVIPDFR